MANAYSFRLFGNLAGAEGFEPPKAVLETAGLPLAYAPVPLVIVAVRKPVYLIPVRLFGFPMRLVLAAVRAELLHFKTLSGRLFVLGVRVVPVLAFLTLERDDFSWHFTLPRTALLNQNLADGTRAHGAAAFANGEAQTLIHGDRRNQFHNQLHVVARHHHFGPFRHLGHSRHVRGAEVELRPVALEERSVTSAFFFRKYVNFALELLVSLDRTRLRDDLSAFDVVFIDAAQQQTNVIARPAFIEQLLEHFDARDHRLAGVAETDDFHFLADFADALFDTAGDHRAAALNREDIFNRHQERPVDDTFGNRDIGVDRIHQLVDLSFPTALRRSARRERRHEPPGDRRRGTGIC